MMRQIRDEASLSLPRLGAGFLLLMFLVSFARTPVAYGHEPSSGKTGFAAVIFDGDSADRHDLSGSVGKIPYLAPDGYLSGPLPKPAYTNSVGATPCPPDIPLILPMAFVYTQLTSSDL